MCDSCVLRLERAELKIPLERGASCLQDVGSGPVDILKLLVMPSSAKVIEYKYIVAQEDSGFANSGARRATYSPRP